jgi:hypothetical protein
VAEGDEGRNSSDDIVDSEGSFANPDAHARYAQDVRKAKADGEVDGIGETEMARHGDVGERICSKD